MQIGVGHVGSIMVKKKTLPMVEKQTVTTEEHHSTFKLTIYINLSAGFPEGCVLSPFFSALF